MDNLYDDVHREAMHDYDPEPEWEVPTRAELEAEMDEDEVRSSPFPSALYSGECGEGFIGNPDLYEDSPF